MQYINDIFLKIDSFLGASPWFPYVLLGIGLFFTIYLRFPQFRFFSHAISVLFGRHDSKEKQPGDTSHFQALSTALSGTVGTGNIAGVALAIHLGGPSALFWMLITAFLGMTTKLVEVTLSHKYREVSHDGLISGGPMYYMKNKLNMRWLAVLFSIATILSSFGTGNLPQINSIANSIKTTFGIESIITGAVLSVFLGLIIVGGIKRIAKVTERLVPTMSVVYVLGALSVLFYNYQNILPSIISIFSDVFTGTAATGGFLGSTIVFAFNRGVNRGLFSNEAGQGSAPIAHASAKTKDSAAEGTVALLEPFIDTICICTLTGLTILSSGVWKEKFDTDFQRTDMMFFETRSLDGVEPSQILSYLDHRVGESEVNPYSGTLQVVAGKIQSEGITLLHARSLAKDIRVELSTGSLPYEGTIEVHDGKIMDHVDYDDIVFKGGSLLHSSPLTVEAFKRGFFGNAGQYIISIGLLLFAFSTSIAWSYYGGRAVTYLMGSRYVLPYRILYILGFFIASFVDTTLVWTFSGITIALMTLPNLLGIFLLRRDVKDTLEKYEKKIQKKKR